MFLKCGACAFGAAILNGCKDSPSSSAARALPVPLGRAGDFPFGVTVRHLERLVVVRDEGGFGAMSLRCTHQECLVTYTSPQTAIECPCHGARFSPDGIVLSGPAPTDLPWYEVRVDDAGMLNVVVGATVTRDWRLPWNDNGAQGAPVTG